MLLDRSLGLRSILKSTLTKTQMRMKKLMITFFAAVGMIAATNAQTYNSEINARNSWLKVGAGVGIPVGKLSDQSSFALSADLKGQFLSTPHVGFGLTTGYTHYFPKENFENFGSVPVGIFGRYYFKPEGLFLGADLGYSIQTGTGTNGEGGVFVKPQIGYHNRAWNVFGYYNGVFRSEANGDHLQHVGIGVTYNIMFR